MKVALDPARLAILNKKFETVNGHKNESGEYEKSKFFNAKIVLSTSHIPFTAHFFDDAVEVEVSNKFKNVLDKLKSL